MKTSTISDALITRFLTEIDDLYGNRAKLATERALSRWQDESGKFTRITVEDFESIKREVIQECIEHFAVAASTADAPFASD